MKYTLEEMKNTLSLDYATDVFTRIASPIPGCIGRVYDKPQKDGYIEISYKGESIGAHVLVWLFHTGMWPVNQIDHWNGIKHDNRIENLRDFTNVENGQAFRKTQSNNTSGYTGVYWSKRANKWIAQIKVNGKRIHLGLFDTVELAYEAYVTAKRLYHATCVI